MSTLTDFQKQCLDIIVGLNGAEFGGWFKPSWCMATIQIESAFRPRATRFEPRLNEASYGLGQVLESTARSLGLVGAASQMFQPLIGIRYMMRCHQRDFETLHRRLGRAPTLDEWTDAYNRGAGGADLGDPDHAYVDLWDKAQAYWSDRDETTAQAAQHSPPDTTGVAQADPTAPKPQPLGLRDLQQRLVNAGAGIAVDGLWGPETQQAAADYYESHSDAE